MRQLQQEGQTSSLQYLRLQQEMQASNRRFSLASSVLKAKHDIAMIERDPQRCAEIGEKLDVLVVPGVGTSPPSLEAAGIADAELCIAVTSVDEDSDYIFSPEGKFNIMK